MKNQTLLTLLTPILLTLLPTPAPAQDYAGLVMPFAGIHFLVPSGFDLSTSRVRSEPGPADLALLEPRDGMVAGHPNSSFLSLTVHAFDISAADAVDRLVGDLRATFEPAGPFTATPEDLSVGGAPRAGVRLAFQLGDVPLEGHVAAWQLAPELTLVAYTQGRAADLAELNAVFEQILASVGAGAPEPPAESQPEPTPQPGTGEGSESSSPSQLDAGAGPSG